MKRIVRLTESDLTRIVRRVISESEDALANEIDAELDRMSDDDTEEGPGGPLQKLIDKIEAAGHNVEEFLNKLKRNKRRFMRKLSRSLRNLRFRNKPPMPMMHRKQGATSVPKWN